MKQDYVGKVTYFAKAGKHNTVKTLEIAKEKAVEACIRRILIASTRGETIKKALEVFDGIDVQYVVVGGRRNQFPDKLYETLKAGNHIVIFNSDYDFQYPDIVWEILRRFSEGMKVCVQMNIMTTDLGFIPAGEEVIAIAGTGREDYPAGGGADTAIVTETVKSSEFFKLDIPQSQTKIMGRKIKEILCKPR